MSIQPVTYYQAACDYPGCTRIDDEGDYSAWSEPDVAAELAIADGWHRDDHPDGTDRLYCPDHDELDEETDDVGLRLPDGRWIRG